MKNLTENIIKNSISYSDVLRKLKKPINGTYIRKLKKKIQEEDFDISHFDPTKARNIKNTKYKKIKKECPVCETLFETKQGSPDEKTVCSHACSNTYFRSGPDNGNWSLSSYRTTCFHYHKKECVICGENKIVEVHHLDNNHNNNDPSNLIPLCPTHHQYWHSRYREEIKIQVLDYIKNWKVKNLELSLP